MLQKHRHFPSTNRGTSRLIKASNKKQQQSEHNQLRCTFGPSNFRRGKHKKLINQGLVVGAQDDKSHPWQVLFTINMGHVVKKSARNQRTAPLDAKHTAASGATEQGDVRNPTFNIGVISPFPAMAIQGDEPIQPKPMNQKRERTEDKLSDKQSPPETSQQKAARPPKYQVNERLLPSCDQGNKRNLTKNSIGDHRIPPWTTYIEPNLPEKW